jgi:glutaredoxin-like protein
MERRKSMAFIQDSDKPAIKEALSPMKSEVTLSYFTQEIECDYCRETRDLLEELCALEDRIKLRVFDFKNDPDEVAKYRIDKIPATVVANGEDLGIRFYGIPAGYEFSSLLHTIVMVSQGESSLSAESKKLLKEIKVPVHLQVFVTPT